MSKTSKSQKEINCNNFINQVVLEAVTRGSVNLHLADSGRLTYKAGRFVCYMYNYENGNEPAFEADFSNISNGLFELIMEY